jgi:hypothetical protein
MAADRLLASIFLEADYTEYISENLRVDYLPESRREIYKLAIMYYTKEYRQDKSYQAIVEFIKKNRNDLGELAETIIILTEEIKTMPESEIRAEIKRAIGFLKAEFVKARQKEIQGRIREIEAEKDNAGRAELDKLLYEFTQLSLELKDAEF